MKNFKNNWIILALVPVVVLLANTTVMANEVSRVTVSDVNKQVISKQPYRVEVCTNQTFQNDTTGDMLLGGIIGGLVGNQIGKGGGKNAATGLGALTDSILFLLRSSPDYVGGYRLLVKQSRNMYLYD